LAIVCGVFLLRGSNWARWLLLAWIAFHVVLSAFHNVFELAMHSLLLVVVAYCLFRPRTSAYFLCLQFVIWLGLGILPLRAGEPEPLVKFILEWGKWSTRRTIGCRSFPCASPESRVRQPRPSLDIPPCDPFR